MLPKEKLKKISIQLPITNDQRLQAIVGQLRGLLNENLTLEGTASQWGLSVRSLTRLFQTKLHITFIQ